MPFLKPYFLAAAAVILIPLLIHLLTRDRIRKVTFSTIRFLAGSSRKILRKKKVRESILLALRMLVFGLLVLAFARPLPGRISKLGATSATKARVILLDLSASMAGAEPECRARVEESLKELVEGVDVAALITFDSKSVVACGPAADFSAIRARLAECKTGNGGTDIPGALRKADSVLAGLTAGEKSVVLVSDLQRTGWQPFLTGWKLAPGVKLVVGSVRAKEVPGNVAVTEVDFPHSLVLDKTPRPIAARVFNGTDKQLKDVEVTLTVDGKQAEARKVSLPAGRSIAVRFRVAFGEPGDHMGIVEVAHKDSFPADNKYYFNTRVIPARPVLLVTGAGDKSDTFISTALEPPGADSPFHVKTVAVANVTARDVDGSSVVVFNDVDALGAPVMTALSAMVQRGGGLLFLPGDKVNAGKFNSTFGSIVPAKLGRIISVPVKDEDEQPGLSLARINLEHPVFEIFQRPHYGDLAGPRFLKYWELTGSQLARIIARYSDDRPAILEHQQGDQGIAVMITSSINSRWNNLVVDHGAIFVSCMHQIVRHLAIRGERKTDWLVGDTVQVAAGEELVDPDGNKSKGASVDLAVPGFYTLTRGAETFRYSVNRLPGESDTARVAEEEITAAVVSAQGENEASPDQAVPASRDEVKDISALWRYLVMAVVLLLIGELFLGNRTLRH